jgi:hypothetical protein
LQLQPEGLGGRLGLFDIGAHGSVSMPQGGHAGLQGDILALDVPEGAQSVLPLPPS